MGVKAVDLNKAIVCQVGYLGDAYNEWVHQPIVSKHPPRLFENNFGECLTRTPWWLVPSIWLPFVAWNQYLSMRRDLALTPSILAMAFGLLAWTLTEYILHRFVFHMQTSTFWGNTLHYLIHGYHHKHPMDGYRLVFPPIGVATLYIPFWTVVNMLFPHKVAPAIFSGLLLGYILYDMVHYYLHHGNAFNEVTRKLKKYHMNHHYKSNDQGFGVTSTFWDWAFGTFPSSTFNNEKIGAK